MTRTTRRRRAAVAAVAAATLVLALAHGARAQEAPADCTTAEDAAAMQATIQSSLDVVRKDQRAHEDEVDREMDTKAAAAGWSRQRQSRMFLDVLSSPQFAAIEKEKQPYTMQLVGIAMSKASDPQTICANGLRIKDIIDKVKVLNAREYGLMSDAIRAAR